MHLFGDTRVLATHRNYDDDTHRRCLCDREHAGWRERGKRSLVAVLLEDGRLLALPPSWLTEEPDPPGWPEERDRKLLAWRGPGIANDIDWPVKLAFAMAANQAAEAVSSR